jgi:hypothetical protein
MVIAFTWHTVYNGYTKEQCAKNVNLLLQVCVAHLMVQKEDKSLTRAFVMSVLTSPLLKWIMSIEFCMVPTHQSDNGPAKHTKLQESIKKHKKIQDKIEMALIPDLQSLDIQAPQQKSMDDEMEDSIMAVAEKQNPMAHHLLMRIEMKDMPKMKLFMDVGLNWNNTKYIASFLAAWKDKACLVATNVVAISSTNMGIKVFLFSQSRFGIRFGLKG